MAKQSSVNMSSWQYNTTHLNHDDIQDLACQPDNHSSHAYSSLVPSNAFSPSSNLVLSATMQMDQRQFLNGSISTPNFGFGPQSPLLCQGRPMVTLFRVNPSIDVSQTKMVRMMQQMMMRKMMRQRLNFYRQRIAKQGLYSARNRYLGSVHCEKLINEDHVAIPLSLRDGSVGDDLESDASTSPFNPSTLSSLQELKTKSSRSSTSTSFPMKLYKILHDPGCQDCISWLPHGRAWKILQPKVFQEKVVPTFFRSDRYASFMRQVCFLMSPVPIASNDISTFFC
jgi:HSF-type DNA-binding